MSEDSDNNKTRKSIGGALSPEREFDDGKVEEEDTGSIEDRLAEQGMDPDEAIVGDYGGDDEDDEVSEEEVELELISDYVDFDWGEQWNTARNKIDLASEGDGKAYADLSAAPGRVKDYFLYNKIPRDTLMDIVLPLTLTIYGVSLLIISFLLGGELFTQPNRIADIFVLDTIILMFSIFGFIYLRQKSDLTNITREDVLRRRARAFVFFVHLIPSAVVGWLLYATFGGGQSGVESGVSWFMGIVSYWDATLPQALTTPGELIWSITPIGITIQETAFIMMVSGIIGSFPFILVMGKVLLISINVGVREDYKETDDDLGLMDAVKGVGEVSGRATKQIQSEIESTEDEDMPKSVEEIQQEETPDVLKDVESKLTMYEEPDDLLETHDDFRLEEYEDYVEIDRYWLKEPYSYAVILYNEDDDDHRYFAIEPQLNDVEKELYREFRDRLETALRSEAVDDEYEIDMVNKQKMEILEQQIFEIATEYNIDISDLSLQKIMYYVERDYVGYRQIDVLMNDINAEDISCVGPNQPIWINHSEYENIATNIQFERRPLQRFISQLAQRSGEQISAADPMQDATLPDGSRAQLTLGDDITTEGSTFTIRQFQDIPFTPVDLIRTKTFNLSQMAFLWLAIQNNQSLIFAGGTASGKTTSMNAMSLFIPPKAKVVTLEDTREITLPHENWIPGKTREGTSQEEDASDEISMYNLLEAALRQRPEYLVVGEVRGDEAQTLFQAMSTGHTTYSTMHADTVREAIHRLENDPINVPEKMVNNLDIICIQRRMMQEGSAIRRNINVTEINEAGSGSGHSISHVFERDPETDDWIDHTNDSSVLQFIKEENVWSQEELRDEMQRRKDVLQYLIDQNVYRFRAVTRVIQKYMNEDDKETFMEKIENETLEPRELEDITNIDLESVETRMHEDKTEQIMK